MQSQKFSILIPAYNEEKTIFQLLEKVVNVQLVNGLNKEIIIIDDGSKDYTRDVVKQFINNHPNENIRLISHKINQGKGMAIRTGINAITGDFVIIQDADLELDPMDYNPILLKLLEGKTPVVYGSRFLDRRNRHYYKSFYYGGLAVTTIANILFGLHLTDESTCYKAFKTDLLRSFPLKCKGFEFCPEVTARVARQGIRIPEVPIHYYPRSVNEGKKIRWSDGFEAIWTLIKYRFISLK